MKNTTQLLHDKLEKSQHVVYNFLYLKNFIDKPRYINVISFIYNFFILSIPFLSFVPIICAFFTWWNSSPYYLILFIMAIFYIIDYFARLFTLKLCYETPTYKEAAKKQIFSIWSNYQFISSIVILALLFSFGGYFNADGITIQNHQLIDMIIAIVLFINFISVILRFVIFTTNLESIAILKKIFFSKYKSYITCILILCITGLLFAFIIYSTEITYVGEEVVKIKTMGESIYYSFVVMTTVGFGDYTAVSDGGRACTLILALLGICFYAYVGSVFVGIFVEFSSKKKAIRLEAKSLKEKERELHYIINSVDNIVIKNLYEVGLITKEKYEEISLQRNRLETMAKYEFNKDDFEFHYPTKTAKFLGLELGIHNRDEYDLSIANKRNWFAVRKKPENILKKTVLYLLPFKLIAEISTAKENFPIIFSSKVIDNSIERIIAFHKTPYKAVRFEANLKAVLRISKEDAWKYFGKLTNLSKKRFDALFAKDKKVSVLLIKDIISYSQPKLLETYGINVEWKLQEVIYLT